MSKLKDLKCEDVKESYCNNSKFKKQDVIDLAINCNIPYEGKSRKQLCADIVSYFNNKKKSPNKSYRESPRKSPNKSPRKSPRKSPNKSMESPIKIGTHNVLQERLDVLMKNTKQKLVDIASKNGIEKINNKSIKYLNKPEIARAIAEKEITIAVDENRIFKSSLQCTKSISKIIDANKESYNFFKKIITNLVDKHGLNKVTLQMIKTVLEQKGQTYDKQKHKKIITKIINELLQNESDEDDVDVVIKPKKSKSSTKSKSSKIGPKIRKSQISKGKDCMDKYKYTPNKDLQKKLIEQNIVKNKPTKKDDMIEYICQSEENQICDPSNDKFCEDQYSCDISNDKNLCINNDILNSRKLEKYNYNDEILFGNKTAIANFKKNKIQYPNTNFLQDERSPQKRTPSPQKRSVRSPQRRTPSPQRRTPSPQRRTPSPQRRTPSPQRRTPSPQRRTPSPQKRSVRSPITPSIRNPSLLDILNKDSDSPLLKKRSVSPFRMIRVSKYIDEEPKEEIDDDMVDNVANEIDDDMVDNVANEIDDDMVDNVVAQEIADDVAEEIADDMVDNVVAEEIADDMAEEMEELEEERNLRLNEIINLEFLEDQEDAESVEEAENVDWNDIESVLNEIQYKPKAQNKNKLSHVHKEILKCLGLLS